MAEKRFRLQTVLALMLLASALTCVVAYFFFARPLGFGTDRYTDIRAYARLRLHIDDLYVGDAAPEVISDAALSAAVEALDDRWSYYFTPEEYRKYLDTSRNVYTGIGIVVTENTAAGGILIQSVYEGSPGEEAGLLAGETIIGVDGSDFRDMDYSAAVSALAGELGHTAELTLLDEMGGVRTAWVTYREVYTAPISSQMLEGEIGYVRIRNFDTGAAEDFIAAVEALAESGARGFIYDVRNNGGGKVSEMTKMLDFLLPEGEIFVSVMKDGGEDVIHSDAASFAAPARVLVNGSSYSAAEYFAAVLREYDYASIIGERTTGKNRSQITIALPDGGALHLSTAEYLTPNRVSLTLEGGLVPDVEVSLSEEDAAALYGGNLAPEDDVQLSTAMDALKSGT